ncbi:hypothetical protein KR222_011621 [Zaprionus bogoriensis]|nr:hypothetical protein KR222_011621 [Zaprionus bogoriensis]
MNVLNYGSYEEYLDHFINVSDVRYMRNWALTRKYIQNACGKSCMGRLLSRAEYEEHRKKLHDELRPRGISESTLFGEGYDGNDNVLRQFAKRELLLLSKQSSTIIFLLMRSEKGLEVSSLIDLEQSFRESHYKNSVHYVNWPAIFAGKAKLMPKPTDLSYFDWYKNKVNYNDSDNFTVVTEGAHSLLMMHRGDHKIICVNAGCRCSYTRNARRRIYSSNIYGQCIFFDHVIRRIN